ncbi:MAG TPA: YbaN family protein [Ignavibacteria bacterium]|jgi:hypothetical protein
MTLASQKLGGFFWMSGSRNDTTTSNDEIKLVESRFLRIVYLVSGFILVGIGVAGMFLPLLPTTVFLLLAAWCFARSSERFYRWLHYNRIFGKYIRDYQSGKGMSFRSKIVSIIILWAGIGASAYWGTESLYVRLLLFLIAIGVTWHLVVMKSADPESLSDENGKKK